MQDLALNLVTVLDQLRVSRVLALGDGAGGNIVLRCGIMSIIIIMTDSNPSLKVNKSSYFRVKLKRIKFGL